MACSPDGLPGRALHPSQPPGRKHRVPEPLPIRPPLGIGGVTTRPARVFHRQLQPTARRICSGKDRAARFRRQLLRAQLAWRSSRAAGHVGLDQRIWAGQGGMDVLTCRAYCADLSLDCSKSPSPELKKLRESHFRLSDVPLSGGVRKSRVSMGTA